MCYNFATFVLYLDVITLIYRENRLTSSETCLSATESSKSKDLLDFFLFNFLCSMYENDFLSAESGFLKFLFKTCWLFVRNFLILP